MGKEIFVFGSNLAGRHGAGAAKFAVDHHGAIMGVGRGPQGDSYAIPTKNWYVQTLPFESVKYHVGLFLEYARRRPELTFRLTAIGCGLAGFTAEQIAPLVSNAPDNVRLPPEFRSVLEDLPDERFWSMDEVEAYQK